MPRCSTCDKSFSRDDHLRRHESIHGFPRFACQHPGCGMRFHRRDVLGRHGEVHSRDPRKRRRRPRRGALPRITGAAGPLPDESATDLGPGAASPVEVWTGSAEVHVPVCAAGADTASWGLDSCPFGTNSLEMDVLGALSAPPCGAEDWLTPRPGNSQLSDLAAFDGYDLSYDLELGVGGGPVQPVTNPRMEDAECPAAMLSTEGLRGVDPSQEYIPVDRTPHEASIPGGHTAFRRCIAAFQARCLPLLPMLPAKSIQSKSLPMELMYSMAALGAQHVAEHEQLAKTYYHQAVECLQAAKTISRLRLVQTRVLLVEYAAWQSSRQMRQWALREREVARGALLNLINQHAEELVHGSFHDPAHQEILRTTFAFYVQSVNLAVCFGYAIPLTSQQIPFDLPCEEPVRAEGGQGLGDRSRRRRLPFRKVLHGLLTDDVGDMTCLLGLCSFAKDVLVCAVLETIISAASSPLSYATFEDYEGGNVRAISSRGPLLRALRLCGMLWPGRLHDYWDALAPAHPELEGALMVRLAMLQLNRVGDSYYAGGTCPRQAAATATEVFCSIGKSGFQEVRRNSSSLGARARHCAIECARAMVKWLDAIAGASEMGVDERDAELLGDIHEALVLGDVGEGALVSGPGRVASGSDVQDALFDTWSELFGSQQWVARSRETAICC